MAEPKYTTAGALLLKHSMPTEEAKNNFDIYRPLDKAGVTATVNMLLKHGGENSHEHINNLAKLFFNTATDIGASTPLSDYINDSDERQAIIGEYDHKVQKILASENKKIDKDKELAELTGQYNKKIEKQNLEYLVNRGSMAARMAKTGARGNPAQLATGTATPLMSLNSRGELVPLVIRHSFAEGMSPAEQIAMSYMGRGNTVLTQLSTALPGALFKRLGPTVFHDVVTIEDCGTHNGVFYPLSDKKAIVGRYEAGTNRLITEDVYRDLEHSNVKEVKIRSTLTCEAPHGVCKKCYGLVEGGRPAEIGENVGVVAAQSISEVLTQSMLSTKHKATVGERKGNAYEQAANILNNPSENFKDEATISEMDGKVSSIETTPLGDHTVTIAGKKHFVPRVQQVLVKEGDKVFKGARLSTGTINPRKLVQLRGIGEGRSYLSKELREIYGGGLDPRHFDVVARNLIKYVQVDDPGETGYLPGDRIPFNQISKHLRSREELVPVSNAEGKILSRGVLELTPGTTLDQSHIDFLKSKNVEEVHVAPTGLKITPLVPGLQTAKLLDKNWISRLSLAKIKDSLQQAAALGEESEVHSVDPITPYIIGHEFGEGSDGKY